MGLSPHSEMPKRAFSFVFPALPATKGPCSFSSPAEPLPPFSHCIPPVPPTLCNAESPDISLWGSARIQMQKQLRACSCVPAAGQLPPPAPSEPSGLLFLARLCFGVQALAAAAGGKTQAQALAIPVGCSSVAAHPVTPATG